MAIYFFDKNQTLIKIVPDSATFEAIQTQELDDDSLLKDTLSVTIKGDEKLLNAEYMAVKSYTGNAQTFDMYRIVTDTTPDKSMSFTGMSLAPYELNGHIIQDLRPANHSLSYTLNRVLDGTDWRVGYIDDGLQNVTTTFYYVSAKEALKELQSLVGCEFVFKVEISGQKITDKWIEVYSEMGNRTKKRFNYGTNALTVVRETNKADIYTALIGRGKGEEVSSGEDNESGQAGYGRKITFEDIEWSIAKGNPLDKPKGQYYLELPQATQAYGIKNIDGTMKARVGIVDFDDEEDKNRLINLTYQQLLVSSRPKVLFKATVANVGATGIGDTVTIHRHDLNIHYQTRVRKIVRNKLNDNKTQIELGDAVVTASTKRDKQNNSIIKNLNQEIEKVKADVTISQTSADGKNTIFYGSAEPTRKHTGDIWYRPHPSIAGETQMLVWNGTAWELVLDTSDLTSVSKEVEEAAEKADEAVQAAKDADDRANEAIEKAGANSDVLTTHQNTLNTINNTTIPNVNKIASDAMTEAKSALSSASSAMTEAQKADGKIASYVTQKGLVSGTTVDSKINTATGEINKKITTVEGKIPTELGGRNLIANTELPSGYNGTYLNFGVLNSTRSTTGYNDTFTGQTTVIPKGEDYVVSFYAKASTNSQIVCHFYNPNSTTEAVSSTGQTSDKVDGGVNVSITTEWQRYWVRWKQSSTGTTAKKSLIVGRNSNVPSGTVVSIAGIKLEQGTIPSDWTPAPEDNYTQEEFSIFESTYKETVKGINSSLTDLSNKKLDGTTYTTFYNNEYKSTAQGVTDTYTKVNKIIDANGNSTDTFAKAVYDRNATRQSADFTEVTKDLVTTATYTAGVKGINTSITEVEKKIPISIGNRNYIQSKLAPFTSYHSLSSSDDGRSFKFTMTNNNNFIVFNNSKGTPYDGISDTYTFSAYVLVNGKIPTTTPLLRSSINTYSSDGTSEYDATTGRLVITQKMTKFNWVVHMNIKPELKASGTVIEFKDANIVRGSIPTDWSPAPEDMLGQSDFSIFKNDYDKTAKGILSRLTAIDSSASGSVVSRLNKTESTASGNSQLISTINKNYVKQSNIDASILADKKIKDTRNANQLPSWYFSNYPSQEVREFKLVSTMGIGSGTYGILTTNVPWAESSGGAVKQTFETNAGIHTRQGNSAGTAWGAWVKQIDTADTTYQKITQTSSLYERVLGSTDETGVKSNISRIVQTSGVIQFEVASAVPNPNLLSGTDFKEGLGDVGVYNRTPTLSETSYFPYGKVATIDTPETSGTANLGFIVKVPKKDTWYTLSFYGSTDWIGSSGVSFYSVYMKDSKNYKTPVVPDSPLMHKIQITFQVSQDDDLLYVRPQGNTFGDYSNIVFYGVKVEVGEVATPWENSDPASSSKFTQLANSLRFKVSKENLLSDINLQAGGVLITSGTNKLNVTPETTYIEDGTIKSAMIESLEAGKIKTGTLDASKVKVINLDAENITTNQATLIKAGLKSSSGGTLELSGDQLLSTASDGSQVYLQNGVVGVRRPPKEGGGSIGQIGYVYDGGSPTYTIQTSWGSHFALKQRFYDTYTKTTNDKRAMFISTGDDGVTTVQFYAKDFILQGDRNLRFGYDHYINGTGNDLTLTGQESVTVRAKERTIFVVSSNGTNNYASMHANLNMQGNTVTNTSDIRLKRDVVNDEIDSLSALMKWQHAGFNYINPNMNQERQFSVIAQSAPDIAFTGEDGYLQVSLNKQVNMTSHALQQHVIKTNDEVEQLKAKIATLEKELATLKGD